MRYTRYLAVALALAAPCAARPTVWAGTTGTMGQATTLSMEPLLLLPHPLATHSLPLATTPPQLDTRSRPPATMQGTSSPAMQQEHQATSRPVPVDTRATRLQRPVTGKLRRAAAASICRLSLCQS